jgi:hypothetical protein
LWHIQLIKVKENKYEGSDRYTAGTRILVSHTTEKKSYRPTLLHMKLLIDKSISFNAEAEDAGNTAVRPWKLPLILCMEGTCKFSTPMKMQNFIYGKSGNVTRKFTYVLHLCPEHLRKVICVQLIPHILNNDISNSCLCCHLPSISTLGKMRQTNSVRAFL